MESTTHCQKCQQPLAPGVLVCPNCGTPAPGVFFFEPSQAPAPSGPATSKRDARFKLGLAGIIGGSLCGCLALVLGFVYLSGGGSKTSPPAQVPAVPPAQEVTPNVITTATSTQEATLTEVPAAPALLGETPVYPVDGGTTKYFDDFSNINGPWKNTSDDSYSMGYFQKGNYSIALRVPQKMAVAFPPYPFTKPIKNIIVSVKAKGNGQDGFYGLLCHFQDKDNYYRVSFTGDQYAVDKRVNGQLTELTSPFWKKIIAYQPDSDGYITIILACTDGRVQLVVDDIGQEIITTTDLDQGDALLFAASGTEKDDSGVYEQAFFDDFSAELQP
jgi:hypothetical protein